MWNILEDHINEHLSITGPLGQDWGSIEPTPQGFVSKDRLGNIQHHWENLGNQVVEKGEFGQHLGTWSQLGNQMMHHNSVGHLDQTMAYEGNHLVNHNAMGQAKWSYDPMTGSVSNSLGLVMANIKSRP